MWLERLARQRQLLAQVPWAGKLGGATGGLNAHYVAYPDIDWIGFADKFLARLGLDRLRYTTQIGPFVFISF